MECSGRSLIFDLDKNLVAAAQRSQQYARPLHERSGCHSLAERRNRLVSQDAGTLTQIVNQHGYGSARCALGRTSECSARDVQVCPLIVFCKLRQEAGRSNAARAARADVGQVRKMTVELSMVFLPNREAPSSVMTALSALSRLSARLSSFEKMPVASCPRDTMIAPVKVAISTTSMGENRAT